MNLRLLLILSILYFFISFTFDILSPKKDTLEITFFDVGQGDSIYIKLPTGERLLIDGGGNNISDYKLSKKMMYPFCDLDLILVTHPHYDHIGGLEKILQRCSTRLLTFNDIECGLNVCAVFRSINPKNSIKKGDIYNYKDVYLKVLWPDLENNNVDYSNVNNFSVVVFLDYGNFEALFTGDAEQDALSQIDITEILPYIQDGLDVYKVSHHGAINGLYKPLLEDLNPTDCVISVGENSYGHPHSDVLDYLRSINCNVKRTDELGDITYIF